MIELMSLFLLLIFVILKIEILKNMEALVMKKSLNLLILIFISCSNIFALDRFLTIKNNTNNTLKVEMYPIENGKIAKNEKGEIKDHPFSWKIAPNASTDNYTCDKKKPCSASDSKPVQRGWQIWRVKVSIIYKPNDKKYNPNLPCFNYSKETPWGHRDDGPYCWIEASFDVELNPCTKVTYDISINKEHTGFDIRRRGAVEMHNYNPIGCGIIHIINLPATIKNIAGETIDLAKQMPKFISSLKKEFVDNLIKFVKKNANSLINLVTKFMDESKDIAEDNVKNVMQTKGQILNNIQDLINKIGPAKAQIDNIMNLTNDISSKAKGLLAGSQKNSPDIMAVLGVFSEVNPMLDNLSKKVDSLNFESELNFGIKLIDNLSTLFNSIASIKTGLIDKLYDLLIGTGFFNEQQAKDFLKQNFSTINYLKDISSLVRLGGILDYLKKGSIKNWQPGDILKKINDIKTNLQNINNNKVKANKTEDILNKLLSGLIQGKLDPSFISKIESDANKIQSISTNKEFQNLKNQLNQSVVDLGNEFSSLQQSFASRNAIEVIGISNKIDAKIKDLLIHTADSLAYINGILTMSIKLIQDFDNGLSFDGEFKLFTNDANKNIIELWKNLNNLINILNDAIHNIWHLNAHRPNISELSGINMSKLKL